MKRILFALASLLLSTPCWGQATLTFYGVELKRFAEDDYGMMFDFVQQGFHPKYVINRTPVMKVNEDGFIVLSDYFTSRSEVEAALKHEEGAKIVEFRVLPKNQSPSGNLRLYPVVLGGGEDSVVGDVWIQKGKETPIRIEKNILLGYYASERPDVFKVMQISDKKPNLIYCIDKCFEFDFTTKKKIPHS